jgi:dTDP-4-dehydrorhamnose reductase
VFQGQCAGAGILAEEARSIGSALIHYSTDYVFDGRSSRPYTETDPTAPLNSYGTSKLAGERAIEATGGAWMVLRTSWVYGGPTGNFVTTMLRLARERDELRVVEDQIGAPTWSRSIAAATGQILAMTRTRDGFAAGMAPASGVYHLTAAGTTSWHGFATAILALDPARDEHSCTRIVPISTDQYPTPARRPLWSVMSNDKLAARFGLRLPSWEAQLQLFLHPRQKDGQARSPSALAGRK